jgi:hypothetical protein
VEFKIMSSARVRHETIFQNHFQLIPLFPCKEKLAKKIGKSKTTPIERTGEAFSND